MGPRLCSDTLKKMRTSCFTTGLGQSKGCCNRPASCQQHTRPQCAPSRQRLVCSPLSKTYVARPPLRAGPGQRPGGVHTWGGRWSAIDMLCEALFVNFFDFFVYRLPCAKIVERPSRGLRRPPGAFRRLSETFSRKMKKTIFSSFSMKVQHEIVFYHGRGKFLNNFI